MDTRLRCPPDTPRLSSSPTIEFRMRVMPSTSMTCSTWASICLRVQFRGARREALRVWLRGEKMEGKCWTRPLLSQNKNDNTEKAIAQSTNLNVRFSSTDIMVSIVSSCGTKDVLVL